MGGGDVVPDQRKVDVQVLAASLKSLPISFSPSPLSLPHPLKIGVAEAFNFYSCAYDSVSLD